MSLCVTCVCLCISAGCLLSSGLTAAQFVAGQSSTDWESMSCSLCCLHKPTKVRPHLLHSVLPFFLTLFYLLFHIFLFAFPHLSLSIFNSKCKVIQKNVDWLLSEFLFLYVSFLLYSFFFLFFVSSLFLLDILLLCTSSVSFSGPHSRALFTFLSWWCLFQWE